MVTHSGIFPLKVQYNLSLSLLIGERQQNCELLLFFLSESIWELNFIKKKSTFLETQLFVFLLRVNIDEKIKTNLVCVCQLIIKVT